MVLYGIAGAISTCWGDGSGENRRGTEKLDECRLRSVQYRYSTCTYSGKTIITELRSFPSVIFILKTEATDLGFPVVRLHDSHSHSFQRPFGHIISNHANKQRATARYGDGEVWITGRNVWE